MANSLQFVLNLVNRVSAPATGAFRSLKALESALKLAHRASGSFIDDTGRMRDAQGRFITAADAAKLTGRNIQVLAGIMRTATGAASGLGRTLGQLRGYASSVSSVLGKVRSTVFSLQNLIVAGAIGMTGHMVLDAVAFKQNTLTSFEVMAKSRKQGEQIFRDAVKFAADTPFGTNQVVDAYQKLMAFQFKPKEVPIIMKAVGDVAALKGFSQETIDRVTLTLGQIKAKGKLQGEEMMQLAEAGLPIAKIYEVIGQRIGKTKDEVMALQSKGAISSDIGIAAILKAIEQTISGGKLGNLMDKQSKNLTGLWSTFTSRPTEMFMDLDTSPGISSLTRFLSALVNVTDTSTASGQKLKATLESTFGGIFEAIFGPLSAGNPEERLSQMIDRISTGLGDFVTWWKTNLPGLITNARGFGEGLMIAFGVVRSAWNLVKPVFDLIGGAIGMLFGQESGGGATRLVGIIAGLWGAFLVLKGPITAVWGVMQTLWPVVRFLGSAFLWVVQGAWSLIAGLAALVGWPVTLAIVIGAALVAAYNYFPWFRDGVDAVFDWILVKWFDFLGWFKALPGEFSSIGSAIVQGLTDGIYAMGDMLTGVGDWIYNNTVGAAKAKLGIHSPSRVFTWMGQMMSLGMAQGITSGGSGVASAVGALGTAAVVGLAPAAVAAPAGQGGGFGGAPQITVQITLQSPGGSGPGQTGAVAEQIKTATREGLLEAFELLAMEGGYGG